jgi:molybdate transport system regulatory protein
VRLRYKIWLDYRGRAFGDGPARLLAGVQQWGSLRKAAQELGMSYNKAWRILHAAEQRLGFPLLDRSVGGSLGGGSNLTREARDLMERYQALTIEADEVLKATFAKHFADWKDPVSDPPEVPAAGRPCGGPPEAAQREAGQPGAAQPEAAQPETGVWAEPPAEV